MILQRRGYKGLLVQPGADVAVPSFQLQCTKKILMKISLHNPNPLSFLDILMGKKKKQTQPNKQKNALNPSKPNNPQNLQNNPNKPCHKILTRQSKKVFLGNNHQQQI